MKVIILAGGGGTRLFPLSRSCFPKQFLRVEQQYSLLAKTVLRFKPLVELSDIVIVTNQDYYHLVQAELISCDAQGVNILLEPTGRNTAPAIALATRFCIDKLGADKNEILFITPSDIILRPEDSFKDSINVSLELAEDNKIVTFGVKPTKPETSFGYIQIGKPYKSGYTVGLFREKPDYESAAKYLASGNYYWNAGMFTVKLGLIFKELEYYQPEIFSMVSKDLASLVENFDAMPDISFDYAVAEKSKNVVTLPLKAYWNDIGSWDAIYEIMDKDNEGNAIMGDCITIDCKNNLMLGRSRLIAGVGLDDLIVVETDDVILVAQKGESQKVRDLVGELRKLGRPEVDENTTMFRPWGSYTVLGEGPGYKMKKIVVNPGQQLSLQLHYHRSEHWVIIGGTAKVTIGESEQMVHKNQSVFIPPSTKHRLENPGKMPLEIIEVQNGDYLEEDDIVR
ncbi:MAG: mannose-1-phosphate guanylyltransferase/mannose-6-phosphate isomerase, partial [Veillonellaceae bacterium]|nr:mannose-1-phosphate guanylyltransferase/mannose-6-phosphate isomerase [Veillonellaceae bacterium]